MSEREPVHCFDENLSARLLATPTLERSTPRALPSRADSLPPSHFLFLSSCPEPWGGSEELWSAAARKLANEAHRVTVCKTLVVREHPRIAELARAGIVIDDYWRVDYAQFVQAAGALASVFVRKRLPRFRRSARKAAQARTSRENTPALPLSSAQSWRLRLIALFNAAFLVRVKSLNPDFAVISQGENFDGVAFAAACRKIGLPYVLICQKASDFNWPMDTVRDMMQDAFRHARAVYFVSEHNRALTERQLAFTLPNAEVVRNPFMIQTDSPLSYPPPVNGRLRLACVARLFALEKGQDMLLQVLSQEKWRRREIDVNFYGHGVHRIALEQAAGMLGLDNVSFEGFTEDVTAIWRTHHALLLPSRCEGLPLVLVEAMLCGRTAIVTNAGGNREVVSDEETGFLACGTDAASLEEAMERAWSRRADWERMGQEAARRVRKLVPSDPGGDFAMKLTAVFHKAPAGGRP